MCTKFYPVVGCGWFFEFDFKIEVLVDVNFRILLHQWTSQNEILDLQKFEKVDMSSRFHLIWAAEHPTKSMSSPWLDDFHVSLHVLNTSCIKKPRIIGCKCMAQTYGKHTRLPNHQSLKKTYFLVFRHCKLSLRMDFVDYILKHQREPTKNPTFSESPLFNQWKSRFCWKTCFGKKILIIRFRTWFPPCFHFIGMKPVATASHPFQINFHVAFVEFVEFVCQTSDFLHCCESGPKPKLWHGALVQKKMMGPSGFMVWLPAPKKVGCFQKQTMKNLEQQAFSPSSIGFFKVFVNPGCSKDSKDSTGWRIYKSWGSPTSEQGAVPKLEMTWQRWETWFYLNWQKYVSIIPVPITWGIGYIII